MRRLLILLTLWLAGTAAMWAYPPLEWAVRWHESNYRIEDGQFVFGPFGPVVKEYVTPTDNGWRSSSGVYDVSPRWERSGMDSELLVDQQRLWAQRAAWTALVGVLVVAWLGRTAIGRVIHRILY